MTFVKYPKSIKYKNFEKYIIKRDWFAVQRTETL